MPANMSSSVQMTLSKHVHDRVPFVVHNGSGAEKEIYLARNISFQPIAELCDQISNAYCVLKNRGEAHITIVTPPEYTSKLNGFVSVEEMNSVAWEHDIQGVPFDIIGLGSGSISVEGRVEETFYLVVRSPGLNQIRETIFNLALSRGAKYSDEFVFYPHITVGFTLRDLFIQDGIIKDSQSLDKRFVFSVK
jgi:hypothetical protein